MDRYKYRIQYYDNIFMQICSGNINVFRISLELRHFLKDGKSCLRHRLTMTSLLQSLHRQPTDWRQPTSDGLDGVCYPDKPIQYKD